MINLPLSITLNISISEALDDRLQEGEPAAFKELEVHLQSLSSRISDVKIQDAGPHNVVTEQIGPTGQYPYGKTTDDDLGGLNAALSIDRAHGRLRMDFGKPVPWISMTSSEARIWAGVLLEWADTLDRTKS